MAIGKALVALVLLLVTMRLFTVSGGAFSFGILLLVFFTLPTVFVVFFKGMTLKKYPGFAKPWKVLRVVYALLLLLFVVIGVLAIARFNSKAETQKAVDFINSQKITLDDVMGKNLPPSPDQTINDSTIAGIDANKNGIRDDVELAIFKEYPNSAKIRAAELQYAQSLQLELTKVSNSETMMAFLKKSDSAYQCIGDLVANKNVPAQEGITLLHEKDQEISNLTFNTDLRKKKNSDIYDKYMTSYASQNHNYCDIELSSLPN